MDDVGWKNSMEMGRSRGLIKMWDNNKGALVASFQGQGYMGVVLQ
jgi:hypothetical protein